MDGRGRYAREHRLRVSQNSREACKPETEYLVAAAPRPQSPSPTPPLAELSKLQIASPWAVSRLTETEEKLWSTSPRQQADEAWLREFEDRKSVCTYETQKQEVESDTPDDPNHTYHKTLRTPQRRNCTASHPRTALSSIPDSPYCSESHRPTQDSYDSFPSVEGCLEVEQRHRRERSYHSQSSRYELQDRFSKSRHTASHVYGTSPNSGYDSGYASGYEIRVPSDHYPYSYSATYPCVYSPSHTYGSPYAVGYATRSPYKNGSERRRRYR